MTATAQPVPLDPEIAQAALVWSRTTLRPEFRGAGTYRALVKSPTEFMVQAARALDATKLSKLIVASGSGMGQMLFDPPDVGGWPNNEAWISSNTVIERVNFVTGALAQATSLPPSSDAVKHQLDGIVGPQTASMLNSATDERIRSSTSSIQPATVTRPGAISAANSSNERRCGPSPAMVTGQG